MIILVGKTTAGKDTISKELVSKHGFQRCVTYTTRPMRNGETQDVAYHFISKEDFEQKVKGGFFAEWKSYNTVFGIWYYGTALEDIEKADNKTILVITPDGYRDIIKKVKNKPKAIYIYANNPTIKKRLIERGDDKKEAERRLESDNIDFKGIEKEVDKIVYNNIGTKIEDVVNKILEYLEEYD